MKLYTYFRSSAAYRVRIALNLKKLDCDSRFVNLLHDEQRASAYLATNPQGLVPALEDEAHVITQSIAIIEYLDERYPDPPLLPREPDARAHVRAMALAIACDIHPLNNLRVLRYLENTLGCSKDQRLSWYRHWIAEGFTSLERSLADNGSDEFCYGDAPTLADIALVPQVFNAQRYACDLAPYPRIRRVNEACVRIAAFREAAPANQADSEGVNQAT
jgi:maleylacetoacetate isomerase